MRKKTILWHLSLILLLISLVTAPLSFILALAWGIGSSSSHPAHYELILQLYVWYTYTYPFIVLATIWASYKFFKNQIKGCLLLILPLILPAIGGTLTVKSYMKEIQANKKQWITQITPKPTDYVCNSNTFITISNTGKQKSYVVSHVTKSSKEVHYYQNYHQVERQENLDLSKCKNASGDDVLL